MILELVTKLLTFTTQDMAKEEIALWLVQK